jgi:hypothetical protein
MDDEPRIRPPHVIIELALDGFDAWLHAVIQGSGDAGSWYFQGAAPQPCRAW